MQAAVYRPQLVNLAIDPCPQGTKNIQLHGGINLSGRGSEVRVGTVYGL